MVVQNARPRLTYPAVSLLTDGDSSPDQCFNQKTMSVLRKTLPVTRENPEIFRSLHPGIFPGYCAYLCLSGWPIFSGIDLPQGCVKEDLFSGPGFRRLTAFSRWWGSWWRGTYTAGRLPGMISASPPGSCKKSGSGRVCHPTDKEDSSGFLILDQENERVVGPEDRWTCTWTRSSHSLIHDNRSRCRRLGSFLVHIDKCLVDNIADVEVFLSRPYRKNPRPPQ